MNAQNPDYKEVIKKGFAAAPFVQELGIELLDCGPGWCETQLSLKPRHLQQNGVAHAGVQSTLADHTAGAAATTLVTEDEYILTVEYKINLLRAAAGPVLKCRAEVLKPGKNMHIVESSLYSIDVSGTPKLAAKGTFTMSVLKAR
jgi:uncharacterized protein (TIGR00369 family)